jgi:hypothetical protein
MSEFWHKGVLTQPGYENDDDDNENDNEDDDDKPSFWRFKWTDQTKRRKTYESTFIYESSDAAKEDAGNVLLAFKHSGFLNILLQSCLNGTSVDSK